MGLSRSVEYAVQATAFLAQRKSDAPIPCRQIAEEANLPGRFLLQILRQLVKFGILRSTRGVDGGYILNRSPSEISLLDLCDAVSELSSPAKIIQYPTENACNVSQRLQSAFQDIEELERQQLSKITIAYLALSPSVPPPYSKSVGEAKPSSCPSQTIREFTSYAEF